MFFSTRLAICSLVVASLNGLACVALASQSWWSGNKQTNPGFIFFWTAMYSAGGGLCFLLAMVIFLANPGPGNYPVLSFALVFFWSATKVWNTIFNLLLATKFRSNNGTIQLNHQRLHLVVVVGVFLLTLVALGKPGRDLRFSYNEDGAYYELHFPLRWYGFFMPGVEVVTLIVSLGLMTRNAVRANRTGSENYQDIGSEAVRSRVALSKELKKAYWFYLPHPLLVCFFTVLPAAVIAAADYWYGTRPDDPNTWLRSLLVYSLYGGEGMAISVYRLRQLAATRAASHSVPLIQDAIDNFRRESFRFALQAYMDVEKNRRTNRRDAERDCEPEFHSLLLADLEIIQPLKFQILREQWAIAYEQDSMYTGLCNNLCDAKTIPLENMEVAVEAGEALADYLQSIVPTKTLRDRNKSLGYYDIAPYNSLLERIYGAVKVRLHAGPCFSVVFKEKFDKHSDEVLVSGDVSDDEKFAGFTARISQ